MATGHGNANPAAPAARNSGHHHGKRESAPFGTGRGKVSALGTALLSGGALVAALLSGFEHCAAPSCPFDLPSPGIEEKECAANCPAANSPSPAALTRAPVRTPQPPDH